MEILRHTDTTSLVASFQVSSSAIHTLEYDDLLTGESFSASATPLYGTVSFTLNSKYLTYTGNLVASVKNVSGDVVALTNIDVVRPYCNTDNIASALNITDGSELDYERITRYIIDSQTQGFSFVRKEKEVVGNGSDYLPVDEKIYKIYKVYQNGHLIFDSTSAVNEVSLLISKDGTSIISVDPEVPENKINYKQVWRERYLDADFNEGSEYVIDGDFGWKVIPQDVQEASELLIQDLKNNTLQYVNRYIESFDNDDYKIKFAKGAISNTGNVTVDKILEKYRNRIRLGVL